MSAARSGGEVLEHLHLGVRLLYRFDGVCGLLIVQGCQDTRPVARRELVYDRRELHRMERAQALMWHAQPDGRDGGLDRVHVLPVDIALHLGQVEPGRHAHERGPRHPVGGRCPACSTSTATRCRRPSISSRRIAAHRAWDSDDVPEVSNAVQWAIIDGIVDIVTGEGPIVTDRLYELYVRASGGHRGRGRTSATPWTRRPPQPSAGTCCSRSATA